MTENNKNLVPVARGAAPGGGAFIQKTIAEGPLTVFQYHYSYKEHEVLKYALTCPDPNCNAFSVAHGPVLGDRFVAVVCVKCNTPVLLELDTPLPDFKKGMTYEAYSASLTSINIKDQYPKGKARPLDALVPADIAEDYMEAQNCFLNGAYQSCGVMTRRCLHGIVKEKGATKGSLYKQIEKMVDEHHLSPSLIEIANHIVLLGRDGAHPYDGGDLEFVFTKLTQKDAEIALNFCDQVLQAAIIAPARRQHLLEESRKAHPSKPRA